MRIDALERVWGKKGWRQQILRGRWGDSLLCTLVYTTVTFLLLELPFQNPFLARRILCRSDCIQVVGMMKGSVQDEGILVLVPCNLGAATCPFIHHPGDCSFLTAQLRAGIEQGG